MKCPQHYLTDMQEVILFYNGLDVPTRQILDSKGVIPTKTAGDTKLHPRMPNFLRNGIQTILKAKKDTETSDGLATIQAQLNSLKREIKKINKKVYAAQVDATYIAKRHEENSIIIKEIQASTDAAIRIQGASIKTLEIQWSQRAKFTERPYAVSDAQYSSLSSETVPFPNHLHSYCCDNWKEARGVKILETYDHTLPQKKKDP
ncbi:hypothetical protein Tco_0458229 [Tanacetum coccineum]